MEASHFYDNAVVDLEQDVTACEGMLRLLATHRIVYKYSDLLDSCIWSLLWLTWRSGGRETDIFVCKPRLLNLLHQLVFLEHTWHVLARCFQLPLRWGSSKRQRLEHYGSRCPAKPRVRPWKLGGHDIYRINSERFRWWAKTSRFNFGTALYVSNLSTP